MRQSGPTGGAETDRGMTSVPLAFRETTASNAGRELSGMGGGAGSGTDLGLSLSVGGGRRRLGRGGPGSSSTSGKVECLAGREGSLGGRDGRDGSAGGSRDAVDGGGKEEREGSRGGPWDTAGGADLFAFLSCSCCASRAFASSSRRVGGSGGSLA